MRRDPRSIHEPGLIFFVFGGSVALLALISCQSAPPKAQSHGGYQIQLHRHSKSEKLGTVSDVTYEARLLPGSNGELEGTGTYTGKVVTWLVACPGNPEPKTYPVSGKLTATASVGDLLSKKVMTFMLTTSDWPLVADGPPAESAEEKEEAKTTGSVGNFALELQGRATSHADTSTGSLLETPCTGGFRSIVETTVEELK
jgi:hypothetical protein